jgi:hypothetical protein
MRHRSILGASKTGSISRKEARSAALAAKTTQTASSGEATTSAAKVKRLPQTSAVWERFLGQFGSTGSRNVTRSSPASMPARVKETAPAAKKTAAEKTGTKEVKRVA